MINLTGKVIELGGGDKPQFHPNLDMRPGLNVDIVANLEEPLPIEDKSYDGVYCQFLIEHLGWHTVRGFVKEVYRILKPNGKAIFITANLKEQARVIANRTKWEGDYESSLVFGGQDYPENTHRCGFSPEYAQRLFEEVGFGTVSIIPHPNCQTDMIIQADKTLGRIQWCRKMVKELANGQKAVDIGCSDAPISWDMPNVVKVDNEPYSKLSQAAMQLRGRTFPESEFIQASAEDLPFGDKEFPVAMITELLEHVDDPVAVLNETSRVAHKAIITIPNEFEWDLKWKPFQNSSHIRHYTKSMLEAHLKEAGIVDYELDRLDYDGWSFYTVIANLPEVANTARPKVKVEAVKETKILKVALVSTPFFTVPPKGYGGLERVIYDIAVSLAKREHKVTVFAPNGSSVPGCKTIEFGESVSTVNVNWLEVEENRIRNCLSHLLNDGYGIIHGNTWYGMEYLVKMQNPKQKVCHLHHGGLNTDWWGRSKPPWPLNLFALSEWMKKVYASQGFTSRVVYNSVDTDFYKFKEQKRDRLLFVGRASTFKQPHVAIEVAKKLDMGLDLVCGTFVDSEEYLQKTKGMCDGNQIRWIPEPPQEQKVQLMQDAKCVLFPSRMGEPFGLVPIEAMSCGTPIIAVNDGAIPEIVSDGVTGFVCNVYKYNGVQLASEQNPVEPMREAVKKIAQIDPKACRDRVEKMFSREVAAKKWEQAYSDIMCGREW